MWDTTKCDVVKFINKLRGENEIEAALQRLDRLTHDEGRTTAAQTLEIVHGLAQNTRADLAGEKILPGMWLACCFRLTPTRTHQTQTTTYHQTLEKLREK